MNYKKLYEEALERAREFVCKDNVEVAEYIFPELAKSEDERIRKWIIGVLSTYEHDKNLRDTAIAWLEKQHTPQVRIGIEWVNTIDNACDKRYSEEYAHGEYCHEQSFKWGFQEGVAWLEKQDEQKPAIEMKSAEESLGIDSDTYNEIVDECIYGEQKPTDKVESKFQNGQWIVWQNKCYKVNYNGCGYELFDQNGLSISLDYETIEDNAHLWTIQDAKDGDVLVNDEGRPFIFKGLLDAKHPNCPVAYGGVCINCYDVEEFCISERYHWWCDSIGVKPATKEQRDTLMKAMKDARYTFDFEKKKLKKIEENEVGIPFGAKDSELQEVTYYIPKGFHSEIDGNKVVIKKGNQKPVWNEEDEVMLVSIISDFAAAHKSSIGQDKWLKSLKERMKGE